MTMAAYGALLGGLTGAGLLLVATRITALRHRRPHERVLPFVRDLVIEGGRPVPTGGGAAGDLLGPLLTRAAEVVERTLGGAGSVRRRLRRAGLETTVQEFRVQQVLWGIAGFATAAALCLLYSWNRPADPLLLLVACAGSALFGVLLRDNRLSSQVRSREREIVAEFPAVASLLALSVAAGEGPVAALDRVVRRSGGELSADLARVLAGIRTGEPVTAAFDRLASETGVAIVARFAHGVAVAVERGTPLADVLHAQAADVREAGRRDLIEEASRREILMMVPVVFLLLPVTVVFAFYPGLVGLSLTAG